MIIGPLIAWMQKLAVQHFTLKVWNIFTKAKTFTCFDRWLLIMIHIKFGTFNTNWSELTTRRLLATLASLTWRHAVIRHCVGFHDPAVFVKVICNIYICRVLFLENPMRDCREETTLVVKLQEVISKWGGTWSTGRIQCEVLTTLPIFSSWITKLLGQI